MHADQVSNYSLSLSPHLRHSKSRNWSYPLLLAPWSKSRAVGDFRFD